MRLPQHPIRWLLTILFLALLFLTGWILWAVNKLEERRAVHHQAPATPGAPVAPGN
jgi:lipopolysaccharide export system protein LptC